MNEQDKKLLTEFLGECWEDEYYDPIVLVYRSGYNRTFTTWQDLGDCKEKLVEKGKWRQFSQLALRAWWNADEATIKPDEDNEVAFMRWLLNPSTFVPLAVEFLRKEKP
jgi:hypothetical protein